MQHHFCRGQLGQYGSCSGVSEAPADPDPADKGFIQGLSLQHRGFLRQGEVGLRAHYDTNIREAASQKRSYISGDKQSSPEPLERSQCSLRTIYLSLKQVLEILFITLQAGYWVIKVFIVLGGCKVDVLAFGWHKRKGFILWGAPMYSICSSDFYISV